MSYFRQVSQNLKNTVHLFTVIATFAAMLYCFKDFSQDISIFLLQKKFIILYLQMSLFISLIIFIVCLMQPLLPFVQLKTIMRYMNGISNALEGYNRQALFSVLFITGVGIVLVFSYTKAYSVLNYNTPYYFFKRQSIYVFIGIIFLVTTRHLNYNRYRYLAESLMVVLLAVLTGLLVGLTFGMQSQVANLNIFTTLKTYYWEATKLIFVIYLAAQLSLQKIKIKSFIAILILLILVFLIENKHLHGVFAILSTSGLIMVFVRNKNQDFKKYLIPIVLMSSSVLLVFLYHESKVLGGFWGVGVGKGSAKFDSTQLIGPLLIEEFGFLGSVIFLFLFITIILQGISISNKSNNLFGCLLSIGLISIIYVQNFYYFLKTFQFLSVDNITLPFISYGWPQVLTNLTVIGIISNIAAYKAKPRDLPNHPPESTVSARFEPQSTSPDFLKLKIIQTLGRAGIGNGEFNFGGGVDKNGGIFMDKKFLYVTDWSNNRLQRFTLNIGNNWSYFDSIDDNSNLYSAIYVDEQGWIYLHGMGLLKKYNSQKKYIGDIAIDISNFCRFTLDLNGNIYTQVGSDCNHIKKYDPTGSEILSYGGFGSSDGKFNNSGWTVDIVSDSTGNVYMLDAGGKRVQKFDSNGNFLNKWDVEIFGYSYMAIGRYDRIYVSEKGNSTLSEYNTEGSLVQRYGIPQGIISGGASYIFVKGDMLAVSNHFNHNITILSFPE